MSKFMERCGSFVIGKGWALLCGLGITFGAVLMPVASSSQILSTQVSEGALSGTQQDQISAFLGVPYARPPVGELRWKAPLPTSKWSGVRKADTNPASCQQKISATPMDPWTHEYVVMDTVSEDCLYLNIWTPAKKVTDKLPVMIWIHGGAFSSGSASVPIYDGRHLAERGMIVVGINYRLGVYGFLAHPELSAENADGASGNYGMLDQIAALKWVKDNIAAFGGDPDRITVAGQSAGGASVHHLIASPLAKGLFSRAIAQSGAGMADGLSSRMDAEKTGLALTSAVGGGIARLRSLSPEELDAAVTKIPSGGPFGGLMFAPIIDGFFLPNATYTGGNSNDVPVLTGITADEMTGLNPFFGKMTSAQIKGQIQQNYGTLAADILRLYPANTDAAANQSVSDLSRDRGLAAVAFWAEKRQKNSAAPIYAYLWSHWEPGPNANRYRAFHSSEIPYVFGTLDASPERSFTDIDRRLSRIMGDYWANWVKTGNPNGAGLVKWPQYSSPDHQIINIDKDVKTQEILPVEKRNVLKKHVEQGGSVGLF